jgi:hypothetical protein
MSGLEGWLKEATRHLSQDSAAQVNAEIREHYESARDVAMNNGASPEEADRSALTALGDAKAANRQYRKVLLTAREARQLKESNWESRAVCSNRLVKALLFMMPAAAIIAGEVLSLRGAIEFARILLVGGIGMSLLFSLPLLPVYTPSRGRIIRSVKWSVLLGIMAVAFGHDALKLSWLLFSCLWPMIWIEWTRSSIRRKLPVAQWPKHLYL